LDFKSATAKLQRYSLIDEGCWVPPVVHSWISHRLDAEEKCTYIQWLVEELWAEILRKDVEFDNRWEDFLLPPTYHELIIHELPLLRHARVLLEHALSKTVLDSMTAGNYLAHDTVELLYRLGRMLASAGRTKDGVYYLEKAIAGMESLMPPLPPTLISERRLQLAKTRFRTSHLAEAVAEAKPLSESTPSNRAVLWLAQCLQIAGELRDASVIFKNIITLLEPESGHDPDCAKVVFAAAFGAASTLSMMSDSTSKIEARKLIDKYLAPPLQGLPDRDTLKALLYPEILVRRLEVAANAKDIKNVVQLFLAYDAINPEVSRTGGKPLAWCSLLTDLRIQKRWSAIEALGEAFIGERDSFMELWKLRQNKNKDQIKSLSAEMNAWLAIYYRLGTACFKLQQYDKAEKVHWAALGLCLGLVLLPPRIDAIVYGSHLWRLQMLLARQKKDRSFSMIWSYFQDSIEREVERRRDEDWPSEM
jgi:tetratricopeptide (TPR) repeat protein